MSARLRAYEEVLGPSSLKPMPDHVYDHGYLAERHPRPAAAKSDLPKEGAGRLRTTTE